MPRSLHLVSELRAALRTPAARSFLVSQGIVGIVMGIVSAYQVPAMTAAGLSLSTASFWAGFRGLSQLLGRLPLMPMVERFGVVRSMRISYAAMAVGAVALAFAGTPLLAAIYAIVAGFGIGAISPLIGIHSRDVFGADSLGTAMGAVSLVFQVVGAVGPPLAGWLTGQTGTRSVAVVLAAGPGLAEGPALRWRGRLLFHDFAETFDQVDDPVRVAPLVVVPGEDLDQVAAEHLGAAGVEDRGVRVSDHVGGDDVVLGVLDDPPERAIGRRLHRGVHLLDRHVLVQFHHEVDDGAIGHGHPHCEAVETALQAGEHLAHRLGGAGGGGDDVLGGRPAAAEV